MENFGDNPGPAMNKVSPPVFDLKVAFRLLGACLIQKDKLATVVEFPGDASFGKLAGLGYGRSWRVFAKPGGIHHQGTWL